MTITHIDKTKRHPAHTQIELDQCYVRLYGDQTFSVIPPKDMTYGEQVMAVATAMVALSDLGIEPRNLRKTAA